MRTTKNAIIATLIILIIIFSGCSPSGNIIAKNAQQKEEPLKIGLIAPLSGQYSKVGIANLQSAKLAEKDFANIQIIPEDDKFDTKQAVSAYQKLKNVNNIDALIVVATPSIEALKPLIEQDQMPTIVVWQDLNTTPDYIFHIAESIFLPYEELGKEMKQYNNPVFLVQESSWSEEIIKNYKKGAGQNANIIKFNQDDSASTTILKLQNGNYDAFSIDATPQGWIPLYNRIYNLKLDKQITHILNYNEEGNFRSKSFEEKVNNNFFENKTVITIKTGSNTNQEFMNRYKQTYNQDLVLFGDFAYDAIQLFLKTNPKTPNWTQRIQNYDFTGITGKIEWDENGDRKPLIIKGYIQNGKLIEEN